MNTLHHQKGCVIAIAMFTSILTLYLRPAGAKAQSPQPLPLVVMGPPDIENGRCFRELFEHPDQWVKTRGVVNELLLADHDFNEKNFSDDELRAWLAQIRRWNLKLELEVGAIKEWGVTGEGTLRRERATWDRIVRLGGRIDSIAMDEPLCCTKYFFKPPKSVDYAVRETANFIAAVRRDFPQTAILDIETFPSLSIQENEDWIDALQKKLVEMKVRGLDGYRLDVDSVCYSLQHRGSWDDVASLQQFCHTRNIPFSLLYWAPGYNIAKALGTADDSTWYTYVMQEGYDYDAVTKAPQSVMARNLQREDHFGHPGSPDQYVIESYVGAPLHTIPETDDWTFTRSVLDFANKFVLGENGNKPASH